MKQGFCFPLNYLSRKMPVSLKAGRITNVVLTLLLMLAVAVPALVQPAVVLADDAFTKLANPATLPAGNGYGVAFSPNSTYMAVAHATSPYITIYKRSSDTFTKLPNPADTLPGTGRSVAFSPDSTYLAVAHTGIDPVCEDGHGQGAFGAPGFRERQSGEHRDLH